MCTSKPEYNISIFFYTASFSVQNCRFTWDVTYTSQAKGKRRICNKYFDFLGSGLGLPTGGDWRRERVVHKEQLNFSDWVLILKTATNLCMTDSKVRTGSISFKEKLLHSLVEYYFKVWLFLFEKQDWQMLFLSWIHFEEFPLFSSSFSFNQSACCWKTQGSRGLRSMAATDHLL